MTKKAFFLTADALIALVLVFIVGGMLMVQYQQVGVSSLPSTPHYTYVMSVFDASIVGGYSMDASFMQTYLNASLLGCYEVFVYDNSGIEEFNITRACTQQRLDTFVVERVFVYEGNVYMLRAEVGMYE